MNGFLSDSGDSARCGVGVLGGVGVLVAKLGFIDATGGGLGGCFIEADDRRGEDVEDVRDVIEGGG